MSDQNQPPTPRRTFDDETAETADIADDAATSNDQPSHDGVAADGVAAEKSPAKKAPAKKATAKKAAAKKAPAKKVAAKKAPAKKTPAKKAPVKKAPAKKAANPTDEVLPADPPVVESDVAATIVHPEVGQSSSSTQVQKAAARKNAARKAPEQKAPAKKAPAKKAPAKKAPAKKAPARKVPAKSAAAKKAAARKTSATSTGTTAPQSPSATGSPKASVERPASVARSASVAQSTKTPVVSTPASRRTMVITAVASLVLVAGAVVGWFGLQHFLGESTKDNRTEAVAAATNAAETIFSFSFDDLETHTAESKALMTPAYAKQFDQIAPALTDIAPQREVVVEAVTRNAAVLPCGDECSDTKTSVLVFVDLDRRTQEDDSSTVFGNRIVVDLVKTDGDWKVGDIRAL